MTLALPLDDFLTSSCDFFSNVPCWSIIAIRSLVWLTSTFSFESFLSLNSILYACPFLSLKALIETLSLISLSSLLALFCWMGNISVLTDFPSDFYLFERLCKRASKLLLPEEIDLVPSLLWYPLIRLWFVLVTSFPTYDLIILVSCSLPSWRSIFSIGWEGLWYSFHIHWRSSRIAPTLAAAKSMIWISEKGLRWWWQRARVDLWRWEEGGSSFLFREYSWHLSWACWDGWLWGRWCQRSGRIARHLTAVQACQPWSK